MKMNSMYHDEFKVGDIVWARHDHDGLYWPGKINFISKNVTDINNSQYQLWSYFIQFFEYNQTHWTVDVLPYREYRDYMSKNLLIHYESYPQIKYQLLNAMNQADMNGNYNHIPRSNSNITDLTCRNSTPHTTSDYSMNYYSQSLNISHQYMSNYPYNSLNNYYSYSYTQPSYSSTNQLSIETNLNNEYHQSQNNTETFQKTDSVIIITTKSYSNSSFISYVFNCFSTLPHHSIIYIDDLTITNYQHPNTSNISYLICFDHFDSTMKQTLNSTILNNLNAHINYLFLILNSPSNELVKHFYSTIMDKRAIVILHYHSTFENEPLLLCSGYRQTFEIIRLTLLKYLCSKIKYIESRNDNEENIYSMNDLTFEYQTNNIKNEPMINIPNQILESKKSSRQKIYSKLGKKVLKRKLKHRLSKKRTISGSSSEYYVENILENCNTEK